MKRMALGLALSMLTLTPTMAPAQTQGLPAKPIHIVVPYPAGGSVDIITRAVTQRLNAMWGQSVVIENKAGGGTQIGAEAVAKSAPDGYTLFATGMETFAITPFMHAKLSYDPDKDFTPVSGLGLSNQFLVVPASSGLKSVRDLIAQAKAKPGDLQYGTIGLGGSSHINMVLFESMAGVKLLPVHYRGAAPALTDVIAGHVNLMSVSVSLALPPFRAGQIKLFGIGSTKRLAPAADIPTVAENGLPGYEAATWFGLFATAGTPRDVVIKLNTEIQKILADPDFREKFLAAQMFEPMGSTPEEFADRIRAQTQQWAKLIREQKLSIDK
jgi:tripartite-type tricarboxylate transporter receptor subunit TctC